MSSDAEIPVDAKVLEQTRKRINQLIEEIARLSDSQMAPPEYYAEFLQRVLTAIAAPAGAIWGRTPQGHLQLQYQINFHEVGLDQIEGGKECHDELLRRAAQQGRPQMVMPHSGEGQSENGSPIPANPTGYVLLLAPILIEKQVSGFIEVWQDPHRSPSAQRGFLTFITNMAEYASSYLRNNRLRQVLGQQQLWTQLEQYTRQIHGSLNPRESAYQVANEGRRLIECDRVSVAVRLGAWTAIEAISGADVIEKRSSLVQTMRALCDQVLIWGEKLVYTGVRDDSLPPKVLAALDAYLAESNSKLLLVLPMRDERETNTKRPCRSALMAECFEPQVTVDQLLGRAEIVTRHAAPALYNALEHKRIPFRWLLQPLANIKDGLRGHRLAIAGAVAAALVVLVTALVTVPWPLRMEGKGQMLPKERHVIYSRFNGPITSVKAGHGAKVRRGDEVLTIRDPALQEKIVQQSIAMKSAAAALSNLKRPNSDNIDEMARYNAEYQQRKKELDEAEATLKFLQEYQARNANNAIVTAPIGGTVITFDPNVRLLDRLVKPGDELLQVANLEGEWEIEMWIPEAQVGHVRAGMAKAKEGYLSVDVLLASHPNRTYKGRLYADGLAGEVAVRENEPGLMARVEIVDIPREELDTMPVGAEVKARIRCGNRAIGYVWFHELWEFFYEHVLF